MRLEGAEKLLVGALLLKSLYLIKISILDLGGCSPIIGRLFSVEGNMSWRISSKTEMDRSIVTLKLSFSPLASLMKNEAKSRMRKKKSGTIRFMTYSIGFLSIVTCKTGRFIRPGDKKLSTKKTSQKYLLTMYLSLFLALDPLKVIKLLSSHSPIVTMASTETLFSTLSLLNVPNFIVFSMETITKGRNCYINCSGGNRTQFTIFTVRAHCWKCDVAGLRIKRKHHEIQTAGVGQPLASTRVHPTAGIHGDQKTLLNAPGIRNTERTQEESQKLTLFVTLTVIISSFALSV